MTDGFAVAGLGGAVAIDPVGMARLDLDALRDAWDGARSDAPGSRTLSVGHGSAGGGADVWAPDLEQLASALSSRVTLALLEAAAGSRLLLHAAALADPAGRVVAFVGRSGSGKTTIAAALGASHGYVSDETLSVDPASGSVDPYRKPLSIIEERERPKLQRAPEQLGLLPLPDAPLRLGAVIVLDRREEARRSELAQLGTIDALVALVPESSHLAALDRPLQRLATSLDRVGGAHRLTYAEAALAAPLVAPALDAAAVEPTWRPAAGGGVADGLRLGSVLDAVREGDRIAVLTPGALRVLDGIAVPVWEAVRAGRPVLPHVVDRLGPAPDGDASRLVAAAVDELVDAGILRGA